MDQPAHLALRGCEGRPRRGAALAMRGRCAQHPDAQRLVQNVPENERSDHDRRLRGQRRLQNLQHAHGQTPGRPERLRGILGAGRAASAQAVASAMRKLFAGMLLVLFADAAAIGLLADGQQDYRPPTGPTPRTPSGKVDFGGVWEKPYVPDMSQDGKGQKGHAELPFTPWGEPKWKTYDAINGALTGACLPFGMTRSMNTPEPMQFMQSDKYLGFLFEQNSWFTVVPIDGRAHRTG